jgi:UDP-N-acetylglucosamine--N-acetylmuramyl-(pentapeptide) pyrophosphoryl-undecaprenol N-acetylglucosamine transferase
MRGPAVQPIVIAAGGTGGHFFPAEALAATLIARGQRVVLMTDARSAALKSPVFAGREQFCLRGAGLAGRGIWRAGQGVIAILAGTLQARAILQTLDAAAIVGFGGYPSVPPVLAARTLRRRPCVILQEQNAVLGRANIFLSRFADRLALGVAVTRRAPAGIATSVTGNPVRPALAALANVAYAPPKCVINLLILGGSLGARIFSDIVPPALTALPDEVRKRLRVTQQCRTEDIGRVREIYQNAGIAADLAPFFDDVADKLANAHLVIARAGASTCAELAVAGRPSILVPLPGAIDDHQTENATALERAGGARVIAQTEFSAARVTDLLTQLFANPALLRDSALAARGVAHADAAGALADLVEHTIMAAARP